MEPRALRYFTFLILPIAVAISFVSNGGFSFLALIIAFVAIPAIELILPSDQSSSTPSSNLAHSGSFNVVLYTSVILHFAFVVWFLVLNSGTSSFSVIEYIGKTTAMGLMCGVYGINVAHELGHRKARIERIIAKALLSTSLYMHFYIEHNKGHHRNVGTSDDPATARIKENVYSFWVRSLVNGYLSAWRIQLKEIDRKNISFFSLQNEMLMYHFIQFTIVALIGFLLGWVTLVCFFGAAVVGMFLLETVNYIEHYGLQRRKVSPNRYENVQHHHSWNSNHVLGRHLLFELSRHSDHHDNAHRPYQALEHIPEAPQMPTGYPGMMLIALVPPVWFKVMHDRIEIASELYP